MMERSDKCFMRVGSSNMYTVSRDIILNDSRKEEDYDTEQYQNGTDVNESETDSSTT